MPEKYTIISYCEHVTGPCNFTPLKRFDTKESAFEYFESNRHEFQDNNPIYYMVALEEEEGCFLDLSGNKIL
jgi:hypothetical protein